jgi:phage shock protein A
MSRWRHWSAGLISRVDWMVSMVENHEALADSAIRDLQRHAARAKVQMGRVRADGRNLRERLEQEREAAKVWSERARRLGREDEDRAIACLSRSKLAARREAELEQRLAEHERIEAQLGGDLRRVEERLTALRSQRYLMRTRQSRADALAAVGDCPAGQDLDDIFDRWDARITERELVAGCGDVAQGADDDSLDFELSRQEVDASLREELAALLARDADPETPNA